MIRQIPLLMTPENRGKSIADLQTQTRRIIDGIDPECDGLVRRNVNGRELWDMQWNKNNSPGGGLTEAVGLKCRQGQTGDLLYLLEPTQVVEFTAVTNHSINALVRYRDGVELEKQITEADYARLMKREDWTKEANCMFMLKSFARYWFINEGVRAQKLQDITEEDAIAEGIQQMPSGYWTGGAHSCKETPKHMSNPVAGFQDLWNSINGKKPGCNWESNPWVFAISYRQVPSAVGISVSILQPLGVGHLLSSITNSILEQSL